MWPFLVPSVLFALLFMAILSLQVLSFQVDSFSVSSYLPWKASYHEKSKKKFWTFFSMWSQTQGAGTSLGAINSESTFQNVFWHTLFIREKSYINTQRHLHTVYQFNVIEHFLSSFHQKEKTISAHKKGQCFWKVSNSRWNANLRLKKTISIEQ